jgi:hypothetical protein
MLLCGQFAMAFSLLRTAPEVEAKSASAVPSSPVPHGPAIQVRYYAQDGSVFLDDDYLINGVAGAIFWKLARDHMQRQRSGFTTRELRLAAHELRPPDLQDNLDVRLLLLQRRLAERAAPAQIEKTGRGRFHFSVQRPLQLVDTAG